MKKLVCTIASSVYEPIRPLLYPMLQRYASRVGAEFHAIEDLKWTENPVLDKLRIGEYLDTYDRLIYFDADMVVRGDCPDLFELVPPHMFGAFEEASSFVPYKEGVPYDFGAMSERRVCMVDLCIAWNLHIPVALLGELYMLKYFNMGMYVCSKEHQKLFRPPGDEFTNPQGAAMPEQCYMNWGIMQHEVPMYHLPSCFNQMPHSFPLHYMDCSYVIHYAGYPTVEDRFARMTDTVDYWDRVGLNGPGV